MQSTVAAAQQAVISSFAQAQLGVYDELDNFLMMKPKEDVAGVFHRLVRVASMSYRQTLLVLCRSIHEVARPSSDELRDQDGASLLPSYVSSVLQQIVL